MESEKVKDIKDRLRYCQTSNSDLLGEVLTLINELENEIIFLTEKFKQVSKEISGKILKEFEYCNDFTFFDTWLKLCKQYCVDIR